MRPSRPPFYARSIFGTTRLLAPRLTNLIPIEQLPAHPTPPSTPGRFILHFAKQVKPLLITLFILTTTTAFLTAIGPLMLKRIIDTITITPPGAAFSALAPWVVIYLGATLLLRCILQAAQNILRIVTMESGLPNLIRRQLYHYLLGHSISYFTNDFAGRLTSKVVDTGYEVRTILNALFTSILFTVVSFVTAIVSLVAIRPMLAIPVLLWGMAYGVMAMFALPPIQRLARVFAENHSVMVGRVVDGISNMLTVKLFARTADEDAEVTRTLQTLRGSAINLDIAYFRFHGLSDFLNSSLIGSSLLTALYLWSKGYITPGTVAMVVPLVAMLASYGEMVANEINHIFESYGRLVIGMEAIVKPYGVIDAPNAKQLEVKHGDINFENVTFAYAGGPPIIENLTLHIPAGQRVGIVGPSGSGKSTFVSLLLRFYDVTPNLDGSGRITIDGQDIRDVSQESLRRHISMVTQDTSLLHRSVEMNLRLGKPEASREELERATAFAHANSFIEKLTDDSGNSGFATKVGERGVKLSGGQRQRIAIARLILKNAPILILDEATSALDSEVEHAIQENLERLMEGKTVIAIAHRLSTVTSFDRIIVLDAGQIVEDGSHAELLKLGGRYARLWQRQSGGFLPEDRMPF